MATEDEMMADLASADAAGDTQLAQHIAGQIKAARTPPPGKMEAFGRGVTKGVGDRIIAGLGAAEQQNAIPTPGSLHATNVATGQPVDEPRLVAERARLLEERRARGRKVETAQPGAYFAGEMVPAVASMAIPGGAGVKGAAAITGGLTAAGSEADSPLRLGAEGLAGAALGGAGAKLLSLLARGAGSVGEAVLPRAQALRDRIAARIGDRSAAAAEATARSAQGTAGAARANASRTLERLGMDMGLPAAEQAANTAAASTPEASQLAQELASRARGELPDKLAHMQVAEALSKQTAAEAAAARSPEAIAAMEKQMRSETARRLLMRYVLPSAGGYVAGEMAGGHGGVGAIAGFGARPMARAVLRGLASPGFTAPASRALAGGAEALSSLAPSAERAAISLSPAIASALEDEMPSVPKLQQLLAELQKKRSDQMVGSNP